MEKSKKFIDKVAELGREHPIQTTSADKDRITEILTNHNDLMDRHKRSKSSIRIEHDRLYENQCDNEKVHTVVFKTELVNNNKWIKDVGIANSKTDNVKDIDKLMQLARRRSVLNTLQLAKDSGLYDYLDNTDKEW